jgi:hypothetical protein
MRACGDCACLDGAGLEVEVVDDAPAAPPAIRRVAPTEQAQLGADVFGMLDAAVVSTRKRRAFVRPCPWRTCSMQLQAPSST